MCRRFTDISAVEIFVKRDTCLSGMAETVAINGKVLVVEVVLVGIQDFDGTIDGGRDSVGIRKIER